MRKRGYSLSLLLLIAFGINLLTEVVFTHADSFSEASISSSAERPSPTLTSSDDCPNGQHPDSEGQQRCADPCHTGRCHFGHCSYHTVKGYGAMDPSAAMQSHVIYALLVPKAPFLEGPKRPPRHS